MYNKGRSRKGENILKISLFEFQKMIFEKQ